jgi:hypothetical protein
MSKSKEMKAAPIVASVLFLMILMQPVFAIENVTSNNLTNFTNQTNLTNFSIAQPEIMLQTSNIHDTIDPGIVYKYKIKIKNVASKDVTLHPKLVTNDHSSLQAFSDSAIKFSVPSVLKSGEVANMTILVNVPKNTTESYKGYIDLNVDGKKVSSLNTKINLNLDLWKQPVVPYVKVFKTTDNAPITIELTTFDFNQVLTGVRIYPKVEEPSFKIGLMRNNSSVNIKLVKSVDAGSLSVVNSNLQFGTNIYSSTMSEHSYTYTTPGKKGNWELTIIPINTDTVVYSVTIGDNNK